MLSNVRIQIVTDGCASFYQTGTKGQPRVLSVLSPRNDLVDYKMHQQTAYFTQQARTSPLIISMSSFISSFLTNSTLVFYSYLLFIYCPFKLSSWASFALSFTLDIVLINFQFAAREFGAAKAEEGGGRVAAAAQLLAVQTCGAAAQRTTYLHDLR